jgi:hypothetical protein
MSNEDRTAQLRQMANIVIDAYLCREQQFIPAYEHGVQALVYLNPPVSEEGQPSPKPGVWYEKSDYEPAVTAIEEKKERRPKK